MHLCMDHLGSPGQFGQAVGQNLAWVNDQLRVKTKAVDIALQIIDAQRKTTIVLSAISIHILVKSLIFVNDQIELKVCTGC